MKRIIDISDRAYNEALTVKEISDIKDLSCETRAKVFLAIKNSTPLEQEPILNKIIAEIEKWHKEGTNWSDIRLMEIEDILNKYKAESEDKE